MLAQRSFYALKPAAVLAPATVKNSEQFTGVVDMSRYTSVEAVLMLGDIANEGIVFRCVACDSDGNNPTATLSGKTMTIAAATTANDGTVHVIYLSSGELLAKASTKRYVKFGIVTDNTSGGPMSVMVRGMVTKYYTGSDDTDIIGNIV